MGDFYKVGETITAPNDIKYLREMTRKVADSFGNPLEERQVTIKDLVVAGTEGIIQSIYTDSKRTVMVVKFQGHRQHVTVVLKGTPHDLNPLVSGMLAEAQNDDSEALEESEADENPMPGVPRGPGPTESDTTTP